MHVAPGGAAVIWEVTDEGRVAARLRAEGEEAIKVAKIKADMFFANIVSDLQVTHSIEATTDELRYSFSKTRPEVTITWRARIPQESVPDVREYLAGLSQAMGGDAEPPGVLG